MSSAAAIPTATGNSMLMRVSVFMIGAFYGFLAVRNMYRGRFEDSLGLVYLASRTCDSSMKDVDYSKTVGDQKWMTIIIFADWSLHFSAFLYDMYIAPIDFAEHDINIMACLVGKLMAVSMCYGFWCIVAIAQKNQRGSEAQEEHEE